MPSTRRTEQPVFLKNALFHVRTACGWQSRRAVDRMRCAEGRSAGVRSRRFIACSLRLPTEVRVELRLKTLSRVRDDQSVRRDMPPLRLDPCCCAETFETLAVVGVVDGAEHPWSVELVSVLDSVRDCQLDIEDQLFQFARIGADVASPLWSIERRLASVVDRGRGDSRAWWWCRLLRISSGCRGAFGCEWGGW